MPGVSLAEDTATKAHIEGTGEGEDGSEEGSADEDDGGDDQLNLEGAFDLVIVVNRHAGSGNDAHQQADDDTESDHQEGVEEVGNVHVAVTVADEGVSRHD